MLTDLVSTDYAPFLLPIKPLVTLTMNFVRPNRVRSHRDWLGRKIKPQIAVESNVPLEIGYVWFTYRVQLAPVCQRHPHFQLVFIILLGMGDPRKPHCSADGICFLG